MAVRATSGVETVNLGGKETVEGVGAEGLQVLVVHKCAVVVCLGCLLSLECKIRFKILINYKLK